METVKQKNQNIIGSGRLRTSVWPILLICVGVIWLLSNFGILSSANIIALLQLWPLLLIVGGFELLFGRTSPQLARRVGIGTLIFALGFMLVAPVFGLGKVDVKTDQFSEPLSGAVTANVTISPSIAKTTITAADDSNNLFDANVTYAGNLTYNHAGDKDRSISLEEKTNDIPNFGFWNMWGNNANLHWDVTLSPTVPINLTVSNGIGESDLDLSKLNLTGLTVNAGVGQVTLNLPAKDSAYDAKIKDGVGNVKVTLPTDSDINLNVNGGTGNVDITIPEGSAVQVSVESGLGKVNLASNLNFVRSDTRGDNQNGSYETKNFTTAAHRIVINYDGGVGNFSIHS